MFVGTVCWVQVLVPVGLHKLVSRHVPTILLFGNKDCPLQPAMLTSSAKRNTFLILICHLSAYLQDAKSVRKVGMFILRFDSMRHREPQSTHREPQSKLPKHRFSGNTYSQYHSWHDSKSCHESRTGEQPFYDLLKYLTIKYNG
jgi:hypothetical protein